MFFILLPVPEKIKRGFVILHACAIVPNILEQCRKNLIEVV